MKNSGINVGCSCVDVCIQTLRKEMAEKGGTSVWGSGNLIEVYIIKRHITMRMSVICTLLDTHTGGNQNAHPQQ